MKARNETYDLVINNGRVMDPETSLDAVRNVGVRDGKIVVITAQAITGQETIDATGHVVAPGFIDGHSHAANDAFGVKKGILDGRTTIMDLGPVPGPWTSGTTALNGEFSVEPASGFGADYDETVEVHEVRLVSKEGTDTCRGERSLAKSEVAVGGEPSTYVFVCNDDLVYTVRATGTEAWVFRPEGTHRLSVVPTEKGASYADGVFELWIRGTAGAARRDRWPAAVMPQRSTSCGVGKGQARWRGLSGGGERAGMELGNFREKSHGADRRLWRQPGSGCRCRSPQWATTHAVPGGMPERSSWKCSVIHVTIP